MSRADWLGSMASQVFALLLVGIITAAGLAFAASEAQRRDIEARGRVQRVVDRVADLRGVLNAAPPSAQPVILGAGPEAPRLVDASTAGGRPDPSLSERLKARLGAAARASAYDADGALCEPHGPGPPPPPPPGPGLDGPPHPRLPGRPRPPPPTCRLVSLSLDNGQRIAVVVPTGPKDQIGDRSPVRPAFLLVLAAAAGLLAFVVARVTTGPLRRLSQAAVNLGRDLDRTPLTIEGPLEVRQAALAFNDMQARLQQTLQERTQMLAAITHDLQTPMTRLRLRLEKVGETELCEQLLADHLAMQDMIREGLDLARASGESEDLVELDVNSLLQALCDDAVAAGWPAKVSGDAGVVVVTRPQALTRCVSNLLDNALKYAGAAEIAVRRSSRTTILVMDRGPGIPPDKLHEVMKPFVRLEASRSRETGGVGLGLTIAKVLAERAGATLQLANRPEGGLVAVVEFERGQDPEPFD